MKKSPIEVRVFGNSTEKIVRCTGEIDISSCEELTKALDNVAAQQTEAVTIDLSGVTFIDSTGVRALLLFAVSHHDTGMMFRTVTSAPVRKVVDLLGVGALLHAQDAEV